MELVNVMSLSFCIAMRLNLEPEVPSSKGSCIINITP